MGDCVFGVFFVGNMRCCLLAPPINNLLRFADDLATSLNKSGSRCLLAIVWQGDLTSAN